MGTPCVIIIVSESSTPFIKYFSFLFVRFDWKQFRVNPLIVLVYQTDLMVSSIIGSLKFKNDVLKYSTSTLILI